MIVRRHRLKSEAIAAKLRLNCGSLPLSSHHQMTGEYDTENLGKETALQNGSFKLESLLSTPGEGADSLMCLQTLQDCTLSDALLWTDNWPNSSLSQCLKLPLKSMRMHIQKGWEKKVAGWINGIKDCRSLKACAIKLWPHTILWGHQRFASRGETADFTFRGVAIYRTHFVRHQHVIFLSSKSTSSLISSEPHTLKSGISFTYSSPAKISNQSRGKISS